MRRNETSKKADLFQAMHDGPGAFILPNAWDALSARLLEEAGFKAIATASAAISWAHGVTDGENLGRDELVGACRRMARAVSVPVSADIEKGYGDTPEECAETARRIIDAGAVGINIEDSDADGAIIPFADYIDRIRAIRAAADAEGVALVINARLDRLYRCGDTSANRRETIDRAHMCLQNGASCIFLLLHDLAPLPELTARIGGPVNVLAGPGTPPLAELAAMGVRRVSLGPNLLADAMSRLRWQARHLREKGDFDQLDGSLGFTALQELMTETAVKENHENPS